MNKKTTHLKHYQRWAVANDDLGIAALVERLQTMPPTLMVLEATGGNQRAVVAALAAAGLPVAVVNPRQARDVAKATGQVAQTDALDARALAHVAEAVRPTPRPLPDAQAAERRALLARRRQLVAMRTAEQNRLGHAPPWLQTDIQAHITWLETRLAALGRRPGHDAADESGRAGARGVAPQRSRHWPGLYTHAAARPARVGHVEPPAPSRLGRGGPVEPGSWHAPGQPDDLGGTRPGAGHALYEYPRGGPLSSGAQNILRAFAGSREGHKGRTDRLHAQAVDDPERHGETPYALATPRGVCRLKAEPLDKQDSCSAPLRLPGAAQR
jgi:hypothetical protein